MRIAILDYGAGNLHSLGKALARTGARVDVDDDAVRCLRADMLVLPGVGAFAQAASHMRTARASLRDALRDGLPALAVCLGMQLLFDASEEGDGAGIGLVPGRVTRVDARRLPHIGWNTIDDATDPRLGSLGLGTAWYANGYACRAVDPSVVRAWSTHEADRFPAAVGVANTVGVQFHPEKSGAAGVRFIAQVVEAARCA